MLKKGLRAQPSGFHLGENKVTPAKKFLQRLSEILTCSHFHLIKVHFKLINVVLAKTFSWEIDIWVLY